MSASATIVLSKSGYQGVPSGLKANKNGEEYGYNLARMCIPDNSFPGMRETFDELLIVAEATPISTFVDYTDAENEDRLFEGLPPKEPNWFPVEDGLNTVETLLSVLRRRGVDEGLLWDLQVSQAILKLALGSGESFRIVVL